MCLTCATQEEVRIVVCSGYVELDLAASKRLTMCWIWANARLIYATYKSSRKRKSLLSIPTTLCIYIYHKYLKVGRFSDSNDALL
ncbi:hypothetical protein DPMN_115759 [Dreissena polymorpha]|uniref:Uncharacterized protein n=1 Tax=Dreissena polymorpha TaxID=45954 RepID=A0A9D4KN20_DREPO|nr:hypothetical protein DPMN_115759 [Dreissena polymorpha]